MPTSKQPVEMYQEVMNLFQKFVRASGGNNT